MDHLGARRVRAIAGVVLAAVLVGGCGLADAIEDAQAQAKEQERRERTADGPTKKYKVVRVVDGDTVELANGEHVRLIGIDAPEDGVCGAVAATKKLTRLVEGKKIALVRGTDNRDRYGRLLRYVDRGATDVGLVMIRSGLAIARYDSRDGYGAHPRERSYLKADRKAAEVGCTAKPAPPEPKPPVSPKPKPKTFVDAPSGCAPGYSPCVPAYPPDLDCADTGPVTVTGPDPHGLDGDGDGLACVGD